MEASPVIVSPQPFFLALQPTSRRVLSGTSHPTPDFGFDTNHSQHLQAYQDSHTIRRLERLALANGLGRSAQGPPMGEPAHGLAVVCRLHERPPDTVQIQGGRYQVR
jgi:hypothetical protein